MKPIAVCVLLLFTVPIAIDGITHMVSDVSGLTSGFRYINEWLAKVTAHNLPDSSYRGDVFGSFISWMRLISGVLFGAGMAAFGLPVIDQESHFITRILSEKLAQYVGRTHALKGADKPNGP
jgi:hypothetical protein